MTFPRAFIWIVGLLHLAVVHSGCTKPRPEPDPVWEAKRDQEIVEWYRSHWRECPRTTIWDIRLRNPKRGDCAHWVADKKPEIRDGRVSFTMADDPLVYNLDAGGCDIVEKPARIWKGKPTTWRDFISEDNLNPKLQREPKQIRDDEHRP